MLILESAELYFAIGFCLMVLIAILSNIAFYLALRKRIPSVSFFLSSTIGYLEWVYLRNRSHLKSRGLDALALLNTVSFLLAVALAILIANLFPA